MDGPLVEQFLQHPEHLDLVFDSCADAVDVPRGHDVVQSEQGVVQPRNHVFVVTQDVRFRRPFIRRHLVKFKNYSYPRLLPKYLDIIRHFYEFGLFGGFQGDIHKFVF